MGSYVLGSHLGTRSIQMAQWLLASTNVMVGTGFASRNRFQADGAVAIVIGKNLIVEITTNLLS